MEFFKCAIRKITLFDKSIYQFQTTAESDLKMNPDDKKTSRNRIVQTKTGNLIPFRTYRPSNFQINSRNIMFKIVKISQVMLETNSAVQNEYRNRISVISDFFRRQFFGILWKFRHFSKFYGIFRIIKLSCLLQFV